VEQHEAILLIGPGLARPGGTWADLGAGTGVFTRALAALVGPAGTVYAVDRDARKLAELTESAARDEMIASIRTIVGDFTEPLDLPPLDGVLLANALHYVPYAEQAQVVRDVAALLVPGASMLIVEYERRAANPWVPYPIPFTALKPLARDAGLGAPVRLGSQSSQFGGELYAASLGPS
jgi:ubiquinone/menaquinone biosynthesis C-methylase UbiE